MFRTILRTSVAACLLAVGSVVLLAATPDVSHPAAPRLIGDFEPRQLDKKAGMVETVVGFSAIDTSGGAVARADPAGEVQIWDVGRGKQASTLPGQSSKKPVRSNPGSHTDLVFSASGQTLVARDASADKGGRTRLRIWTPLASHSKLVQIPLGRAVSAVSPDGRLVAGVGKDDKAVSIWDAKSGDVVTTIPFAKQEATGLAGELKGMIFTPDGRELVLDDAGKKPEQRRLVAFAITPANGASTPATGRVICETDVSFKAIYGGLGPGEIWVEGSLQTSMSFLDGGKTLVTLSSPKPGRWRIHYWDMAKGGRQRTANTFSTVVWDDERLPIMAVSPYGDTLAAEAEGLKGLWVIDLTTGKLRAEITLPAPEHKLPGYRQVYSLFVDAAGKYLGAFTRAGDRASGPRVKVWELGPPQAAGS